MNREGRTQPIPSGVSEAEWPVRRERCRRLGAFDHGAQQPVAAGGDIDCFQSMPRYPTVFQECLPSGPLAWPNACRIVAKPLSPTPFTRCPGPVIQITKWLVADRRRWPISSPSG
jgi:hypothetical protein